MPKGGVSEEHKKLIEEIRPRRDELTDYEDGFLYSIVTKDYPMSPKQIGVLQKIHDRVVSGIDTRARDLAMEDQPVTKGNWRAARGTHGWQIYYGDDIQGRHVDRKTALALVDWLFEVFPVLGETKAESEGDPF